MDCPLSRQRPAGAVVRHARPRDLEDQVVLGCNPDRGGRCLRRDGARHLHARRPAGSVVDGPRRPGLRPHDQRAVGDRHTDPPVRDLDGRLATATLAPHARRARDRLAGGLALVLQPRARLLGGAVAVPAACLPAVPDDHDRAGPDGAPRLHDPSAAVGDDRADRHPRWRSHWLQRVLLECRRRRVCGRGRCRPHPRWPLALRQLPDQDPNAMRHAVCRRHLQRVRAGQWAL